MSSEAQLTVSARLNGSFDISDALDGNTILVVSVNVLVLKFADLVNQNTKLIRDIRNIIVASLTPEGKLLLSTLSAKCISFAPKSTTYGNFHALTSNELHTAHNVLFHLHELRKLLCKIWAELAGGLATEGMAYFHTHQ